MIARMNDACFTSRLKRGSARSLERRAVSVKAESGSAEKTVRRATGAALLSAVIPGLGQIVAGRIVLGLAILAGAAFAWYYATEIWPILIIHFCAAWHVLVLVSLDGH